MTSEGCSRSEAEKQGRIPIEPVAAVLRAWVKRQEEQSTTDLDDVSAIARLAERAKLHVDTVYRIHSDTERKFIEFDTADAIITAIDPWLWRLDPALREIYDTFDFTRLDLSRPLCPDADGLLTMRAWGVRPGALTALWGVPYWTITRSIRARAELV